MPVSYSWTIASASASEAGLGFCNAAEIINDVGIELAWWASAVADPYTSSDANVIQLCKTLKAVGNDLVRRHPWTHLQKSYTFATVNGTADYDLPSDFQRFQDQSTWNRTQQLPLPAGVSGQQWEQLKAVSSSGVVYKVLRTYSGKMFLHPTPTAAETIAFGYQSRFWVRPTAQTSPTATAPTAGTDVCWFDCHLMSRALKLAALSSKGFDTVGAQMEFDRAFTQATGGDGAGPKLSLTSGMGVRLLDERNVPETGFGS